MGIFRNFILVTALACAVSACAEDSLKTSQNDSARAKVIGTEKDALQGSLLIYVDEDLAAKFSSSVPSDGTLADASDLFPGSGITGIKRIFRGSDREVLTKAAGSDYKFHRWFKVIFDEDSSLSGMAGKLAAEPQIQKVQYNFAVYPAVEPQVYPYSGASAATKSGTFSSSVSIFNDPALADQWHYSNDGTVCRAAREGADINVYDAWRLIGGDPEIVVAVVDDGVWYDHPDLKANMWVNEKEIPGNGLDDDGNGYVDDVHGVNFCYSGEQPVTWNKGQGHGTHVAGTVAAVNNNGIGVCGVAGGTGNNDGVRMMTCQIFEGEKQADVAQVAEAIKYAKDNGAVIIQGSFGFGPGDFTNDLMFSSGVASVQADAIDDFINNNTNFSPYLQGGLAIFSAGNNYTGTICYPGAYTDCICVTALGCDGLPALYTNYGYGANIAAPGGESGTGGETTIAACVLSTIPEGYTEGQWDEPTYAFMQGTSMACPHVSGTAALGLAYAKKLGKSYTREEFTSLLLTSVNSLDDKLSGSKRSLRADNGSLMQMNLGYYTQKMGTGSIDAWRLLMQIEGTPCILAAVGQEQALSLDEHFGGNSANLTYLDVTVSDEDMTALGLDAKPVIREGKLLLTPTKYGSGKITVTAVGGGTNLGSDYLNGGQKISRTVSVVTRGSAASNNAWL